jgi:hypothetical protein
MVAFRVKTLSQKELQCRNAEFASEASSISRAKAGIEDDEGDVQDGVTEVQKRALDEVVQDDEAERDVEAKQARFASSRLLDFEGPVSGGFQELIRSLI